MGSFYVVQASWSEVEALTWGARLVLPWVTLWLTVTALWVILEELLRAGACCLELLSAADPRQQLPSGEGAASWLLGSPQGPAFCSSALCFPG